MEEGNKTKQNEWEAYFILEFGGPEANDSKPASLQEKNSRLSKANSDLSQRLSKKKRSGAPKLTAVTTTATLSLCLCPPPIYYSSITFFNNLCYNDLKAPWDKAPFKVLVNKGRSGTDSLLLLLE